MVNVAHPFVAPEEMHAYSILITNRPGSPLGRGWQQACSSSIFVENRIAAQNDAVANAHDMLNKSL